MIRSNVKPQIDANPETTVFMYASKHAAIEGLKKAVAEGEVQILD